MTAQLVATRMLLAIALLSIQGCKNPASADEPVSVGMWGGSQAALTVTTGGAHVDMPCASGDIKQALVVNTRGEFAVSGTVVREAGPARIETPARYTGRVNDRTMTLTITPSDTSQPAMGPFTLSFGTQPSFGKCV